MSDLIPGLAVGARRVGIIEPLRDCPAHAWIGA